MTYPTHKTQATVNASVLDGRCALTAQLTTDVVNVIQAMAQERKTTRSGLVREILTRIAERPDLLVAVLPERS